jgi:phosphoribosyl 1,2-cyclic phosphodiesterase
MRVRFWGTRGSLGSAGPETARYGGNTACVEVLSEDGSVLILDAGSGVRRLSLSLPLRPRIDILLTHLHMDHIQGLGFFGPLFEHDRDVHIWGPPSTSADLRTRLGRYLSPPLFPVRLRDLPSITLHDMPTEPTQIGSFVVSSALVIHPGPTLGFRIEDSARILAYIPDHEPALGAARFPESRRWTSGVDLAERADLLIHDAQYTETEYKKRVGWGHSTLAHALGLARIASARVLAPFHHDPAHDDDVLDGLFEGDDAALGIAIVPAREGLELVV